ncbi:MAG: hypothetical protein WCO66_01740 [Candidatus Absconditabacteria bacterium]
MTDKQESSRIENLNKKEISSAEQKALEIKNSTDLTSLQLDVLSKNHFERELATENLENKIKSYKEFFKAQIDDVKWDAFWLNHTTAGKSKDSYKLTKEVAKSQLRVLEDMEERLQKLTKPGRYTPENANIADYELALTIKQFSQDLQNFAQSVPEFVKFQNDIVLEKSDITAFDLRGSINTIAGAKSVLSILTKFNKHEIQHQKTTLEIAKQEEYARDLKSLESYLQKVISDPTFDPSVLQFTPKYQAAINYLASDPAINTMLKNTSNTEKTSAEKTSTEKDAVTGAEGKPEQKEVVAYASVNEAFSKGGINGMIDYGLNKTNMNPAQKETWKSIGNIGIMVGAGVVAWNFFKNAFKVFTGKGRKDLAENGGRAWIAGPAALMFGANAWKGESITGLLNGGDLSKGLANRGADMAGKGKSAVDKAKSTVNDATKAVTEKESVINEGLQGSAELFNGLTCSQVADLLEKDSSGKLKIKPDQYKVLLSTLKKEPNDPKKAAAAKYLEKIGEKDENNMIDITLTSMGLTLEKLKGPANEKTTFNEQLAKVGVRIGALADLMITKYNHINPEQRHLIVDYIKNPNATEKDLTALEERGDVFEKAEDFPPDAKRKELKDKIDTFTISATEKETLKNSLNSFWHLWPTDEAQKNKLTIAQEGGSVVLTTYGQKTTIDLAHKTIPGFVDKDKKLISFSSTVELLKAVNLTNRIFDLVSSPENKTNISKDPFNVSLLGRDVEYDNTKFYSSVTEKYNHKDITVVSGGIGGALKEISPALEANKDAFINLLNTRFNTANKLN